MRILVLCDRVPGEPRDGLLLRVLALARELAREHVLDLVCFRQPGDELQVQYRLFTRTWVLDAPHREPARSFGALLEWSPDSLYPKSRDLATLFQRTVLPTDYDVIWDAGAVLFEHLPPSWDPVPVLGDLVDDMVLTQQRAAAAEPRWIEKLRLLKYAALFSRFQRQTMRRVQHCVVVSEVDAAAFARVSPQVPVSVIPNGVDTDHFALDEVRPVPGRLVFEGAMSFAPNEQAAVFLVREIMPLVWRRRPDATVLLVGRDPGERVLALAEPRVTVTGSVADVRPHVRSAEIFACPLLSGAGIKNKILQAWSLGLPVVASPLSLGGLRLAAGCEGDELIVRQQVPEFASAIVDLLGDTARRQHMARAGRAHVLRHFTWPAVAAEFEALLKHVVSQGAAASVRSQGVLPP